jgi:hypothetical protein
MQYSTASVVVTAREVGNDVIFSSAGGSFNLSAWTYANYGSHSANIDPSAPYVIMGVGAFFTEVYSDPINYSAPNSFGSGGRSASSSGTNPSFGEQFGMFEADGGQSGLLFVPDGYNSIDLISASSMTFENESFASLGLAEGVYTWSWGIGEDADFFTLRIVATPSISISPQGGSITIEFEGIIQSTVDLADPTSWEDVTPQPISPWVFTPSEKIMFYRAKETE